MRQVVCGNAGTIGEELGMDKSPFWHSYLSHPVDGEHLNEGLGHCRRAFADHRAIIARMIDKFRPDTIAVLGSGYLTDIPVADLIDDNKKLYLFDWIEGTARIGLSRSIVSRNEQGHNCLFCKVRTGNRYCRNYTGEFYQEGVCTAFELIEEPAVTCSNYDPADEPVFIRADITGGVASGFAAASDKMVASCRTPKQAFLKLLNAIDNIKFGPIPMGEDSIDLVTSSMVLSQFDAEPYAYFSHLLLERFGRDEIMKHEAKLGPLMEKLRSRLFILQVEAHVRELHRILKKDGKARAYVSAELFRSNPMGDVEQYFLVQDMPIALEIIGRYFSFEFGPLLEDMILRKSELGDGVSINQNYILIPKAEHAPSFIARYSH